MTTWVLGFDLSLTAPAAVALPLDWRPGDWKCAKAWLAEPPAPEGQDDLAGQFERYIFIAEWAVRCLKDLGPRGNVIGYIEAYGFNKNNANASRLQESGGHVKAILYQRCGLILQPVTSSEARKLTLGFNPRKPDYDAKFEVQNAVFNKFKAPRSWDENQCDAFLCCQVGLAAVGGKILSLPPPPPSKKGKRCR
jgi:hypothetical protein